eukprot:7142665-Karenia_brevis.AAC.1
MQHASVVTPLTFSAGKWQYHNAPTLTPDSAQAIDQQTSDPPNQRTLCYITVCNGILSKTPTGEAPPPATLLE